GFVTANMVAIETLETRLRDAVIEARSQLVGPAQFCAWTRVDSPRRLHAVSVADIRKDRPTARTDRQEITHRPHNNSQDSSVAVVRRGGRPARRGPPAERGATGSRC